MANSKLNIGCLKVEVACLYYLQLSEEKRSRGLLPIIRHMKWGGKPIESVKEIETLNNQIWGNDWIEVAIDGWVHKRLMMLYLDCCKKLSEAPNMELLKKLYNLEVSEDEIVVTNCELQDLSVTPFLNALHEHKAVALLDLSHNLLGNGTMERLQQIFTSSSQKYGGLTLDLHCNRFGPTALFQICECPVLFARLEVLNISGNRLTDACGSYLSTILKNCKALYSLNIEHCSITSRTIQKVADALDDGSVLAQLYLGNNNPISGNAMVSLLTKLANLGRFSELNLNGIKLSKPVVDGLCRLVKTSSLTGLMLGATGIAPDGVLQLIETMLNGSCELVKLDLSDNGLTSHCFVRLSADASLVDGILELNLSGNSLGPEGANALASLLVYPQCHLKVLVLNKCHIGFTGVLQIIHALAENNSLEELHLAENADLDKENTLLYDLTEQESSKCIQQNLKTDDVSPQICASEETGLVHQGSCEAETGCNPLEVADRDKNPPEVADSDDETIGKECVSVLDDSCTSSCQRNLASPKSQFIQELSTAIAMAKQLKLLDLSSNGFTACIAETLYNAWSSRCGLACRHIEEQIIHFSVDGKDCCGVKPCCKRD